jgi:hypothetical protein
MLACSSFESLLNALIASCTCPKLKFSNAVKNMNDKIAFM